MIKIYYAGRDPEDHTNYTKFAVAAVTYNLRTFERDSAIFLSNHPELFEIGIEIGNRKFTLAAGMTPIEF